MEEREALPGEFHVVQVGETLAEISRRSGLSVEEIVEVNGLSSADDIAAGQTLFLPLRSSASREVPLASTPPPLPQTSALLLWPVEGVVLRDFSSSSRSPFDGLLIAAPAHTPVYAARAGKIAFLGDQGVPLGRVVIIDHDDGLITVYAHMDKILVAHGDVVDAGQAIGTVGTSGLQESPRLFFQVRRGRALIDPLLLLSAQ